jgi:hypothetical protein
MVAAHDDHNRGRPGPGMCDRWSGAVELAQRREDVATRGSSGQPLVTGGGRWHKGPWRRCTVTTTEDVEAKGAAVAWGECGGGCSSVGQSRQRARWRESFEERECGQHG